MDEDTRTITLALNNSSTIKSRDMDPTITMNGNLAHNELQGIYNELGYGYNLMMRMRKYKNRRLQIMMDMLQRQLIHQRLMPI